MPWQRAIKIYYATDVFEDTVTCFSSDQLEMGVQVLIRWTLDTNRVRTLYMNYPNLNYKSKAIESITEETVRLITKNYGAAETIEFRDVVTRKVQEAVFNAIKIEPSLANALTSLEFDLKNIEYPQRYMDAIEAKLQAQQEKMQAEFERDRMIVLANATAQKTILEAEGEAKSKIIRAEAEKQAIQLIIESAGIEGSQDIAKLYIYLETLKQVAPDVGVLIVSGAEEGTPIIYQLPETGGG